MNSIKKVQKFNNYTKIKEIRGRSKKKKVWKFNFFKKIKEILSLQFKEQPTHLVGQLKRNSVKYRVAISDFFEIKNFYRFKKSSALYQLTAYLEYRLQGSPEKLGKLEWKMR